MWISGGGGGGGANWVGTSFSREVWGHAPPENFENMDTLICILGCFYPIPEERHKPLVLLIVLS